LNGLEQNNSKINSNGSTVTTQEAQEKPSINGFLDHARQTLQILDQSIADAQQMSQTKTGRGHDNDSRLEWTRELRNETKTLRTMPREAHIAT
jgi:hypothetical protein